MNFNFIRLTGDTLEKAMQFMARGAVFFFLVTAINVSWLHIPQVTLFAFLVAVGCGIGTFLMLLYAIFR